MREGHFFISAILALGLGGCASGGSVGVCALFSEPTLSTLNSNFTPLWKPPELHPKIASKPTTKQVSAVAAVETPEPRGLSAEWWARENARLHKALVICRDCDLTTGVDITRVEKTNPTTVQPAVQVNTELLE